MKFVYDIKQNHGHYELYIDGKLYCCTDTESEANNEKELYLLKKQRMDKILEIINDFEAHGGKMESCPVDWWCDNSNLSDLFRIEYQIERRGG